MQRRQVRNITMRPMMMSRLACLHHPLRIARLTSEREGERERWGDRGGRKREE